MYRRYPRSAQTRAGIGRQAERLPAIAPGKGGRITEPSMRRG